MGHASSALRPPLTQLDRDSMRDFAELLERFGDKKLGIQSAAE
jgi:hypothetical protein